MVELRDSNGETHEVSIAEEIDRYEIDSRPSRLWVDGHLAHVAKVGDDWWVHIDGRIQVLTVIEQGAGGGGDNGGMTAPMPGKVLEVLCSVGDTVQEGQALLVMEAMKMEHRIAANAAGTVLAIHHAEGEQVAAGATLIDIETIESSN